MPVKNKRDKLYKTDIIVRVDKHLLSIEMNADYYPEYIIKNNQYVNVVASQFFETGEKFDNRCFIQLNFDDFDAYKQEELIYEFRVMEVKHHIIDRINYVKYHINLSKLKETCYTNDEEKELVNILKVFKTTSEKELESLRGEVYMEEAINEIKRICRDENIIGLYDAEAVAQKEMNNRLDYAEQKGIEKGKLEIARNMLRKDMDFSVIEEITGLTKEQIETLK